MSANPLARHGGLTYLEIPALDARRTATFYAHVVGWQIDERAADDFRFSDGDGRMIGRFAMGREIARAPGILPFVYVNDLDAAVARARANGGETVKPPYAEGDVRVATVGDPDGNVIGLWQFAAR
jgi:predicted enzyme related to lactoylglutathione lyase